MKGSLNNNSRLVEAQVKEIKKMLKKKVLLRVIAEFFDVSESAIRGIKYGNTWKHIK